MTDMVGVDIRTPQNEILEGSQLPLDYSVQEIIDELIDSLELSRLDEFANPVGYILRSAQQGRNLSTHETVQSANIRHGDTLELQTMEATGPGPGASVERPLPPDPGGQPYSTGGNHHNLPPTMLTAEINVVLSVMDLNRHENVSLSVTQPVGDLIKRIVANYNLPARDNLNQLIKYKLQSKALGRFLEERTTLAEAQIPPLDRLTLHRDEIAG